MGKAGRQDRRRKKGVAGRLLLAIVTGINLGLTLALSLQRRREVLQAVEEDGRVKLLLLESKAATRVEKKSGGET